MKKRKAFEKNLVSETGLRGGEFFQNGMDVCDDCTEPEDEEFDQDTDDEFLTELLGLDSDYTLEDFLDSYDP